MENSAQSYDDIFTARWGHFKPFVMLFSPQGIQELLTLDPKQFDSGRGNGILKPLLGEQSMILLDGDRHQRQRQLLTPPFHGERMRAYGELICDVTLAVMSQQRIGKPFAVRSAMQEISLRVILKAVFGLDEGERLQQLRNLLRTMLDSVSSPISSSLLFFPLLQRDFGSWSPWGRFLCQQQQIDQLIYAEIAERRERPDSTRSDILTLLMSAVDAEGQPMTDQELRDELLTLLVAGHETTASAMTWALYWIQTLPDVHDQLLKEINTLSDPSDPMAVARLPYLNAVCSETLRIYPVAMLTLPRVAKSSVKLMGYEFEPETMIVGCIYLTHHREDIYPEPKCFKPERFLERQFSSFEFLPFGGSNRRCIGAAFAMFEMKLVLATILSHWGLAMVDTRPVRPVRRGVTLGPPSGMQMVLTAQYKKRSPQGMTSSV
jgi:cytochrome P450